MPPQPFTIGAEGRRTLPTVLPTGRIGWSSGARRGLRRFARGSVLVTTVFVDGNNVMGSRADGWWRNRAEAAQRLVAEIAPVARSHGGAWTIVFDGPGPPDLATPLECLSVVHTGHGRRDGADDRIVELVSSLPDRAVALVYTSDAGLRARVHALGARVAGARAMLEEIAAVSTRRSRAQAAAYSSPAEGAARSSYTPFRACPRTLETPRLWLRPPTGADLAHVQRYATREAFYRYLDMDVPTPGSVERYLDSVIAASEDPNATVCVFAIEPKEAGRIGGLIRIEVDDDASGSGNVGYSLDDDFRGRGYTTEALKAMVRLGFETLGLERIWATVDTRNARSWKVLERAGFRRESRMSGHRSIRGAPGDSYLYAICK